MRVLAVLQDNPLDDEVVSAVHHLLDAGDELHVLVLVPPSAVAPTVSRSHAQMATYTAGRPTATGLLLPMSLVHPSAAESEAQAASRVRGDFVRALSRRYGAGSTLNESRLEVKATSNPVEAILQASEAHQVHGIAIGGDDRSWFQRWLRPSLDEAVLRRATVPVLVVQSSVRVPRVAALSPAH